MALAALRLPESLREDLDGSSFVVVGVRPESMDLAAEGIPALGRQAIGMRAVRITAAYEDPSEDAPPGDAVISSYKELLPALGL